MPGTGGIFGTINDASTATPQTDPNAFQYSGQAGGAAARQGQLSALGQMGANGASNQPYQNAQMGALGLDQQAAMGNAPSVAQAQLQQGLAQSQAGAAAQAAGSRGGGANLAAAQNQAANTQAGMAAQANNQSAQLRAQEMATARGQYGDLASQGLGQQMGWNQSQAQLQQGYEGMNNQIGLAQLGAQGNEQQLNSQNQLGAEQLANQQGAGNADRNAGLISGAAGAVGGAAGAVAGMFSSDARAKGSIQGESGGRYMSSPAGAKTNIAGASGAKPGGGDFFSPATYTMSGGNAQGEAQLAARDAHTANFAQLGGGMGNWFNVSNASPWSKEGDAAKANLNHYMGMSQSMGGRGVGQYGAGSGAAMLSSVTEKKDVKAEDPGAGKIGFGALGGLGTGFSKSGSREASADRLPYSTVRSDTRAKREKVQESADEKALAALQGDVGAGRNGFEWMRDQPSAEPPSAADEYMATARPYTYDYKNPAENGGERRLGIMAQNLEQGPTGGDLVKDTPRGKVVDVPALASANSAAVGRLHDRVSALEGTTAQRDEGPAGQVNLNPQLAPEDHGIFSVYDNGTKLSSDTAAKKDAIFQSGVQAGAAATQYAPSPQQSGVQVLRHLGPGNPELDEKWRAAITSADRPTSSVNLPDPPPPPMPDPAEEHLARQLAAYNARSDASLRSAVRGDTAHLSAEDIARATMSGGARGAIPANFQPAGATIASRTMQGAVRGGASGGVFAQRSR